MKDTTKMQEVNSNVENNVLKKLEVEAHQRQFFIIRAKRTTNEKDIHF